LKHFEKVFGHVGDLFSHCPLGRGNQCIDLMSILFVRVLLESIFGFSFRLLAGWLPSSFPYLSFLPPKLLFRGGGREMKEHQYDSSTQESSERYFLLDESRLFKLLESSPPLYCISTIIILCGIGIGNRNTPPCPLPPLHLSSPSLSFQPLQFLVGKPSVVQQCSVLESFAVPPSM